MEKPLQAALILGGMPGHDFDFARLEILKLLAEAGVRADVYADFPAAEALASADMLISYTCNLRPSDDHQRALRDFVEGGKRWLALHGTNAIFDTSPTFAITDGYDDFFDLLGSKFLGHPPVSEFEAVVTAAGKGHPLFAGVGNFTVTDELYLIEERGDIMVLLEAKGAEPTDLSEGAETIADGGAHDTQAATEGATSNGLVYIRPHGSGAVLFNTLGHCNSAWDGHESGIPANRGSWESPEYYEILRRSISWLCEPPV